MKISDCRAFSHEFETLPGSRAFTHSDNEKISVLKGKWDSNDLYKFILIQGSLIEALTEGVVGDIYNYYGSLRK